MPPLASSPLSFSRYLARVTHTLSISNTIAQQQAKGNAAFTAKDYDAAVAAFSEAIAASGDAPSHVLFSNRSAALVSFFFIDVFFFFRRARQQARESELNLLAVTALLFSLEREGEGRATALPLLF